MVETSGPAAGRLKAWLEKAWQGSPQDRAYRAGMLALLLFGALLRLIGWLTNASSLWMDEASWARKLMSQSVFAFRFRPIGFMWFEKQLVTLFGPTEFWLRFVSNIASLIVLLLIPYVASRLLKGRVARLLLVFLFAAQPALIDLSKEFKPYSLEVLVHLVPLVLYLRFRQTDRGRDFVVLLLSLPLAFLFAYNITFAWPGLLLLALYHGYRSWKWRGVAAAVASGALCLTVLGVIYFTLLTGITTDRTERYWANKYDVFYSQKVPKKARDAAKAAEREEAEREEEDDEAPAARPRQPGRLMWTAQKYNDIAALPGLRRELWELPASFPRWLRSGWPAVERWLWVGLHFLALGWLAARKRFEELLLLFLPLACVVVMNLLGEWPIGAFRTNLFLCVYALTLPSIAFDLVSFASVWRTRTLATLVAVLTIVPGFVFDFDWTLRKQVWTRHHSERELLSRLRELRTAQLKTQPRGKPAPLLLDPQTFESQNFYLDLMPDTRAEHRAFFKKHFKQENLWSFEAKMRRDLKKKLAASNQPIWLVVSKPSSVAPVKEQARRVGKILLEEQIGKDHVILLVGDTKEEHAE
jgi:hypothetical protein